MGAAPAAEDQAFSLRNVAVPHQVASAASRSAQAVPQRIDEVPKLPANESRTALTTYLNGIRSLRFCSQGGPMVIGSRMPLSSSTGIITMLMIGAITSSLLVVSASALEAAAQAPPMMSVMRMPSTMP